MKAFSWQNFRKRLESQSRAIVLTVCLVSILPNMAFSTTVAFAAENAETVQRNLDQRDMAFISAIESYFNGIKTAKFRFIQTSDIRFSQPPKPSNFSSGEHSGVTTGNDTMVIKSDQDNLTKPQNGWFYLLREPGKNKGKMRFDYDAPSAITIIANGGSLLYIDRSLDQVSTVPIDSNLLQIFTRAPMKIGDGLVVTTTSYQENLSSISLRQKNNPSMGEVTLEFSQKPRFQLVGWRVLDAQLRKTQVEITESLYSVLLNESLFSFSRKTKNRER